MGPASSLRARPLAVPMVFGMAMPFEAIVIMSEPFRVTLPFVSMVLLVGLMALQPSGIGARTVLLPLGLVLLSAVIALIVGIASLGDFELGALGARSSFIRPLVQAVAAMSFIAGVVAFARLGSLPRSCRSFVRGLLLSGRFVVVYSLIGWLAQVVFAMHLPIIGNDSITADRRDAAFTLGGQLIPRISGSCGEPKYFASLLVLLIALELYGYWARHNRSRTSTFFLLAHIVALFLTFSTGGWIGGVALIVARRIITVPEERQIKRRRQPLKGIVLPVAVFAVAIALSQSTGNSLTDIVSVRTSEEGRFDYLENAYSENWQYFLERPSFGWGLGSQSLLVAERSGIRALGGNYPGLYLASLVERGILGGSLLFLGLTMTVRNVVSAARNSREPLAVGLCVTILVWAVRSFEVGGLDPLLAVQVGIAAGIAHTRAARPFAPPRQASSVVPGAS